MNPGQDVIIALRPIVPTLPWKLGDSVRPIEPSVPLGGTFMDANGAPVTNVVANFGWEYVWHCHLLGHEENDMMRPIVFQVSPAAPSTLTAAAAAGPVRVNLAWVNNWTLPAASNQRIERATNSAFTGTVAAFSASAGATTYSDTTVTAGTTYYYRVRAESLAGYSTWTNTASVLVPAVALVPNAPTNLRVITVGTTNASFRWNNNATNQLGFRVYRSLNGTTGWTLVGTVGRTTISFNNTGLARRTTYFYYVVAYNSSGVSAPSNILSIRTL
jgi:hypothetical protein